jgi:hypothetical protein
MHGRLRKDLSIQGFGLRELTALVMSYGALELRGDRSRIGRSLSGCLTWAMFDHCDAARVDESGD